jgi:hypothetical protein
VSIILALLQLDQDDSDTEAFLKGVAALVPMRTVADFDHGGEELGTFTDATRPSRDEVLELMDQAGRDLDTEIGVDTADFPRPELLKPLALSLLKLRTAMLIELGFPDSPVYDRLEKTYDKRLPSLTKAAEQAGAGDQPGSGDDELKPVWGFPAAPTAEQACALDPLWRGW